MAKLGKAFVYTTAVLGLLTFGACSNSGDSNKVNTYGSGAASGAGAAGGAAGASGQAQGGVGAINGVGGSLGGVGGNSGSGSGGTAGGGGTGAQPTVIDNCPGSLDAAAAQALQAGGTPDPSMKYLYPYDKTVFPRGLLAPVVQWAGPAATAVYIHIKSNAFEYKGCFGATNPLRIPLPANVWDSLTTYTFGNQDLANVELTTASNGRVSGPIKQTWEIAQGTLSGAIFYNTYGSKLPQAQNNGAVMRLVPGQAQPEIYLTEPPGGAVVGPCKSCHSVSANGKSMVVARHAYGAAGFGTFYESYSYNITATPNPAPLTTATLDSAAFAAIYPDGSRFLTNGAPGTTDIVQAFPLAAGNVGATEGPRESRLFTINGQPLTPNGWTIKYAKMPSFAPDGKKIVFNNHDAGQGHSLSIMDFDAATNTFSNHVEIYKTADANLYPGWPFFTPDNKGVIFALGTGPEYAGWVPLPGYQVAKSDLYYVDIASKRAVLMARAGTATSYPGRDEHLDFFPTMSPVAAGGYYWAFFTSRRNYGNLMVESDLTKPHTKQIWGVAIDINAAAGADPSHPPFYLSGQELESGNVRAFAALEPCKADGLQCKAGVDCCCGACNEGKCGCPKGCSKFQEKCETKADCCDPKAECINGFCAYIPPPIPQ